MFSRLFGCCAKGTYSAELYEFEDERICATVMMTPNDSAEEAPSPNKKRGGFFRWHRLTKEEQILRYEKRYLKKFLRHYRMYVTGMTVDQMRMARRLVTMTKVGGGESSSQDRREETNFCAYCCHCFGCAGRWDPARKAIAKTDPNPVDGNDLAEGQITDSTGAPMPSRIIAEAKRVVDQIRKENALKQMGSPETGVANDPGEEKTIADGMAQESNTEMQRKKDQELEPSRAAEILTNDDKRSCAAEADPENAESEPEPEEDDEMLGFIGRGRYISFDQPDCDVNDCDNK